MLISLLKVLLVFLLSAHPKFSSALELQLPRGSVGCLIDNKAAIKSLRTSLIVIAPSLCPQNPLVGFDAGLLSENNGRKGSPSVYVFSKPRVTCIIDSLERQEDTIPKGNPTTLLEFSLDC